ncbi:hybrid sensor histidine kinase/response regulator [Moritella sp. F3]|uniref:hybrid sensor histidine kinase/response regulator n=1 Tax=Moritella sp. F3 TaxID=2718882 RepID=UPI0018E0FF34|nr:ATP-binding protein [Moritella sp. F3]GIC78342.1 hypothetical protein FMO001_30690 [Moritella sp. F1]GIC83725.1 hypothetical protein FMO003_40050 [Moritella sp. F3]
MRAIKVDLNKVVLQYSLYNKIRTLLLFMLVIMVTGMFIAVEVTSQQVNPAQVAALTSLKLNLLWITLPLLLMCLFISKLVMNRLVKKPLAMLQAGCQQAIDEKENHTTSLCSPYVELDGLINLLNKELEKSALAQVNKPFSGQTKQQFVDSLSNDIRTPLSSILGTAELLCEMPQNTKSVEYLKLMKQSASHMLMLLNNVADYSKIESGNLELSEECFDLLEILDQVYTSLRPLAHHNLRVRFSLDYPEDLHRFYIGDPTRLQQVLVNLVVNALKFTDRGFVELQVRGINGDNPELTDLVFTVNDTGIGIPVTKLSRLFDADDLSHPHKTSEVPSGGLSLVICSRLINLMQGTLQVDSTLGEGAKFTINLSLPRVYPLRAQHIVGRSDLVLAKLIGLKVLLVENHKINRVVLQQTLNQLHMQVVTANSGIESLELVQTHQFDLIYMQVHGEDALATIKLIRSGDSSNKKTPIIALTEEPFEFNLGKYEQAAIEGCISKPISKQALTDESVRVLGFGASQANVVQPINKKYNVASEE